MGVRNVGATRWASALSTEILVMYRAPRQITLAATGTEKKPMASFWCT